MAHSAAPALDADNVVALVDDAQLETVGDTPHEAAVDILLPDLDVEVGLLLGESEGPDATVQVGILMVCQFELEFHQNQGQKTHPRSLGVAGNHEDRANRTVLGEETSGVTTNLVSRESPIIKIKREVPYLVVRTRIAPALSSRLALTAAMAMDSTV